MNAITKPIKSYMYLRAYIEELKMKARELEDLLHYLPPEMAPAAEKALKALIKSDRSKTL